MRTRLMSAPLGLVIENLDVKEVSRSEVTELNELFCRHKVLVFRDQDLTPGDQREFAELWGELVPFPYGGLKGQPNIVELRNRGKRQDVNQHWHTDMSYEVEPPKLTMLYAIETPEIGGATAFANQNLAYADLSPGLCQILDGVFARHSAEDLARLFGADEKAAAQANHPIVRTHDETGEKALYLCKAFTKNFCDWSREESKPMLDYLFEHSVRPEYQARHEWRPGDLLMWDNRSLLHYAVHDHGDQSRLLHRLQIKGSRPQ